MIEFRTPRSQLSWRTLEEWYDCALRIDARRASSHKKALKLLHVQALPIGLINHSSSREALSDCLSLLCEGPVGLARPLRGQRQDAPHTPLIVAINNRIAQLDRLDDLASMPDGHNSQGRFNADHSDPPFCRKPP